MGKSDDMERGLVRSGDLRVEVVVDEVKMEGIDGVIMILGGRMVGGFVGMEEIMMEGNVEGFEWV